MTQISRLSDADYAAVAELYSAHIKATGKGSVPAEDFPAILGDELFRRAFEGGFWGPKGTIPGFPPAGYEDLVVRGVQVRGTTGPGGHVYELFVDGALVATEDGGPTFDTVAFAKRHGYDI